MLDKIEQIEKLLELCECVNLQDYPAVYETCEYCQMAHEIMRAE